MSTTSGCCGASPSKLLFDKGIAQKMQDLAVEKQQMQEKQQLDSSTSSAETNTDANSSQQNNQSPQEGFKGLNIDYFA